MRVLARIEKILHLLNSRASSHILIKTQQVLEFLKLLILSRPGTPNLGVLVSLGWPPVFLNSAVCFVELSCKAFCANVLLIFFQPAPRYFLLA
jgi:hypothetical protein